MPFCRTKIFAWHVESEIMLFTVLIIRQLKVCNNLFSNGFQSGILFSNQLINNKANFTVLSLGTNFKYKSLNVTNLHIFEIRKIKTIHCICLSCCGCAVDIGGNQLEKSSDFQ